MLKGGPVPSERRGGPRKGTLNNVPAQGKEAGFKAFR